MSGLPFARVLTGFFYLLSFESSRYLLDTSPQSGGSKIFSPSLQSVFSSLTGSFTEQRFDFDEVPFTNFSFYESCVWHSNLIIPCLDLDPEIDFLLLLKKISVL